MLRLYYHRGILPPVRLALGGFARRVAGVVRIEHFLPVSVVPAGVIEHADGFRGYAVFGWGDNRPRIYVAGDLPGLHCHWGGTRREVLDGICESLAHELAHYEQWRDGRRVTERGVSVRARGIIRAARGR